MQTEPSFLLHCPGCHKVRWFHAVAAPSPSVEDPTGYSSRMGVQTFSQDQVAGYPQGEGWCASCVRTILASEAQAIADAADALRDSMAKGIAGLQAVAEQWVLDRMFAGWTPESAARWFRTSFPAQYQECFDDALCDLYPAHFEKMKKRFRIQVGRLTQRGDLPLPFGFESWLASQLASQPFHGPLQDLRARAQSLALDSPGPWPIAYERPFWLNIVDAVSAKIILIPVDRVDLDLAKTHTFVPDTDPDFLIYDVKEMPPESIFYGISWTLAQPSENPREFLGSYAFRKKLRAEMEHRLDYIVWSAKHDQTALTRR